MPARPEEAVDQERPYVQKGLLGPDGNWLSKRAQQNQTGSSAVASPVQQQKFDGLTGNWMQAIVPRMTMAMTAAPSSVTPVTIPTLIRRILPSA